MWVQVSGMIGANIYQPSDKPRYFKANKGLLVICIWMCVSILPCPPPEQGFADADINSQLIQYPGTFFYYRWRNNTKAKKWDIMTPEQQHEYRQTTTDTGNKR